MILGSPGLMVLFGMLLGKEWGRLNIAHQTNKSSWKGQQGVLSESISQGKY